MKGRKSSQVSLWRPRQMLLDKSHQHQGEGEKEREGEKGWEEEREGRRRKREGECARKIRMSSCYDE